MSATTTTTPGHAIDLSHVLPLTGRRTAARVVLTMPVAVLAVGIVASVVGGRTSGWSAILSLPVPGLGQLVQGRTLVGVLFVVAGLVVWAATIMRSYGWALFLLVPWAVADAATLGSRWSLPIGVGIGLVGALAVELITRSLRNRRIAAFRAAEELAAERPAGEPTAVPAHLVPVSAGQPPALDRNIEAYLRHFAAFGASAPDDWSVFDDPKHVDSALRYQLAVSGWALYHLQAQYTPAYRQAAAVALGNFAERGRDPRVWGYTLLENLKAFRIDGDPFERENVMYSGYLANVIGMFEAMSGDHRYDEPGGYSVTNGRRTYAWDHHRIVDQLALQHAISPLGSITCFPGWMWPACQTFSLRGIQLADLTHGTDHGHAVQRFVEAFPRWFMDDDGSILTSRHVTGVRHPVDHLVVGLTGQAATGLFAGAFDPALIHRNYEAQVLPRLRPTDDGRLELELSTLDTYDTSYGWNPGMPYSFALLYAAELGDHDTAAGIRATLEQMLTPDEARPGPGSLVSMAITLMALINSERALAAGHRHAPCQDTTPELASAPYPQVIVSRATTDGTDLDAELLAGPAANGEVDLAFARLAPGATYRPIMDQVAGDPVVADRDGTLRLPCPTGRTRTRFQLTRTG
ncbi:MAG TPA: hypothetical protein VGA36_04015 [Nitriliruptorales bacterium]